MGMLCHTCHGAGRIGNQAEIALANWNATTCFSCKGLGYAETFGRVETIVGESIIGKVLHYDPQIGAAHIQLEESLHQGEGLMVLSHGKAIRFKAGDILISGMRLQLALSGWEVKILVPEPLALGAWVLRDQEI